MQSNVNHKTYASDRKDCVAQLVVSYLTQITHCPSLKRSEQSVVIPFALFMRYNFVQLLSQDGATPLSMASINMSVGISNRS